MNLVFWSGLAATGPAIAGMMQLTEARWSPSVRRIALTTAGFLPVSFVLILILFAGRATLYGWVRTPIPVKEFWLNTPFFWGRTVVLAAALFLTCFAFVSALLRDPAPGDEARERGRRNALAVLVLFLWVLTLTLWGFDLVMSLDPQWYSGLFGGYFVVSTLYTGFALLSILSVRANARGDATIPPAAIQDVAKLQFAMSIMWMYFFWSQYLVIWYGNVPVETRFFLQARLRAALADAGVGGPGRGLADSLRVPARPPDRPAAAAPHALVVVALMGLVAIFLERVFVVFPSVSPDLGLPFGLRDLAITVGFLGLFLLSRRWFLNRFQPDPEPAAPRALRPRGSAAERHAARPRDRGLRGIRRRRTA